MPKVLGIPVVYLGLFCLALAVVWCFLWPAQSAAGVSGWRYLSLRWGHAAVWFLLAAAALVAGYDLLGGAATARLLALGGLAFYLVFLFSLITPRS